MKKIISLFIILNFWFGCGSDNEVKPEFPEIKNPLDIQSKFDQALSSAKEISELMVSNDQNLTVYLNTDGTFYNGWVKENYTDGLLGSLFHVQDGKNSGLYTGWFKNGKKKVERTWKNGLRDGPYIIWSSAGVIQSRGYYVNDLKNGLVEEFYSNGKIKSKSNYVGGKIDTFEGWQPNGSICSISSIKDGAGIIVYYDETGLAEYNQSFVNGEIDYGDYIENEFLISEDVLDENFTSDGNLSEDLIPQEDL